MTVFWLPFWIIRYYGKQIKNRTFKILSSDRSVYKCIRLSEQEMTSFTIGDSDSVKGLVLVGVSHLLINICFSLIWNCLCMAGAGNLFRARARWDFPEQLVGRSHKRKHHNDDVYIRPLQYFYCKAGKSVRRLVLLAMKKYVNVRLDGWARQQKNVIEMTVRVQAAKEKLRVLHFGQELFATVGAAKHGYDALNVRNNLVSI